MKQSKPIEIRGTITRKPFDTGKVAYSDLGKFEYWQNATKEVGDWLFAMVAKPLPGSPEAEDYEANETLQLVAFANTKDTYDSLRACEVGDQVIVSGRLREDRTRGTTNLHLDSLTKPEPTEEYESPVWEPMCVHGVVRYTPEWSAEGFDFDVYGTGGVVTSCLAWNGSELYERFKRGGPGAHAVCVAGVMMPSGTLDARSVTYWRPDSDDPLYACQTAGKENNDAN